MFIINNISNLFNKNNSNNNKIAIYIKNRLNNLNHIFIRINKSKISYKNNIIVRKKI